MKELQKGQGFVEFALIIPIFLFIIIMVIDPFLFAANLAIAKYHSFYGAREASIYLPDNFHTCYEVVNGMIESLFPMFIATHSASITDNSGFSYCTNTTDDSLKNYSKTNTPPHGKQVTVTIQFSYDTIFWPGGPWSATISTTNVYQ